MRYFFLLLMIFMISCAGGEKIAYICGEYVCKNKKERDQYFKENLVIEYIKITNKKDLQVVKIKEDRVFVNEAKNKAKKSKIKKIFSVKKAKKNKKEDKIIDEGVSESNNKTSSKDIASIKVVQSLDDFDKIIEAVYQSNKEMEYPDINNFPD